jgi:hypothetical protein
VNIIQKFVTVLGSDFLNMKSNVILNLVSIPKHRTVLGVNYETSVSSLPSIFKYDPIDTAVFVAKLAHLTVEKVYHAAAVPVLVFRRGSNSEPLFDLETDSEHGLDLQKGENHDEVSEEDEAPTLEYLREIFEIIRAGLTPNKLYVPVDKERKERVKGLSIQQLFLGVCDSPTRDSLIRCKYDMPESFGSEFVEERLRELYKPRPNVAALKQLVVLMAQRAELSSTLERTRIAIIEWLVIHSKAVKPFLDAVHIST